MVLIIVWIKELPAGVMLFFRLYLFWEYNILADVAILVCDFNVLAVHDLFHLAVDGVEFWGQVVVAKLFVEID